MMDGSLTQHENKAVTLTGERRSLCLEATWELDAIAKGLVAFASVGTEAESGQHEYACRAVATRIHALAMLLMYGVSEETESLDDLRSRLVPWREA